MADLDAIQTSNRYLRKFYPARVLRAILSIIELERACPNHRHTLSLLQSYESFHLQS